MKITENIIFIVFIRIIGIGISIFLFRWLGLKGFFGLIIGMTVIIYLLVTKNMMLRMIINILGGNDSYTNVIINGEEKENK